jgi:hypothetical protein
MLYAFGFETLAVLVSDLYFRDPDPHVGQEGAERGVRLELRVLERQPLHGSIYSAQPIGVGRLVWRADLLESVAGPMGSFDRTHHHPRSGGWEPGDRVFDKELSADPVAWVGQRLADVDGLLAEVRWDGATVSAREAAEIRGAVPEIGDAVRRLLDRIQQGELAAPPVGEPLVDARIGWL